MAVDIRDAGRDASEGAPLDCAAERANIRSFRAEAQELRIELVAHMGHELRSPLSTIIGFSELMFTGKVGDLSDRHKEYLGDILDSSRHLLALIDEVIDLAKVECGTIDVRPRRVNVAEIVGDVRRVLRGLASSRRVRVEATVDPSLAEAVLDAACLKQLAYIYVSNALSLTPEEGAVDVRILRVGDDWLRLEVELAAARADAAAAEKAERRLVLAMRIVEALGGQLGVHPVPGDRNVLWAELPARPPDGAHGDGAARHPDE